MSILQDRIAQAMRDNPTGPALTKALKSIRWRLHCPALGVWAGMVHLRTMALSNPDEALVFDGRDNEARKLDYYRKVTGIHWEIELL